MRFRENKTFTTKSLYSCLTNRGVLIKNSDNVWRVKLPLKIKVFLWQIDNNKLPTAHALKQRGWKGSSSCFLCGKVGLHHIFIECSFARFIWCGIRDALGWSGYHLSWEDWRGRWSRRDCGMPKWISMFIFAGFAWALAVEHSQQIGY